MTTPLPQLEQGTIGAEVVDAALPTIRMSSLDRLALCPASYAEARGEVDTGSPESAFGTVGHAVYAEMARGNEPDIRAIALAHGIGHEADRVRRVIDEAGYTPNGEPEVPVELRFGDITVTGTADLVLVKGKVARVTDYKFSEKRGDTPTVTERVQVPGYSLAVAEKHDLDVVQAVVFNPFLRGRGFSSFDMDRTEQSKMRATIEAVVLRARDQVELPPSKREYIPSAHCAYCPARPTCPALKREQTEVTALLPVEKGAQLPVVREQIPALWRVCQQIEKKVANAKRWMREELILRGPAEGPGGRAQMNERFKRPAATAPMVLEWLRENGHHALADECVAMLDARPRFAEQYVKLGAAEQEEVNDDDE